MTLGGGRIYGNSPEIRIARMQRDTEIIRKFSAGASYAQLAAEYGLSDIRILQIVQCGTGRRRKKHPARNA